MAGSAMFGWAFRYFGRRKRAARLAAAEGWPVVTAKLLESKLVLKDGLAGGLDVQDTQVEVPYYFTLEGGYFGGFVRSVACSDSEGRRIQRQLTEGMTVAVRYNPANPDETCVLAEENAGKLPFAVWPG